MKTIKTAILFLLFCIVGSAQSPIQRNQFSTNVAGNPVLDAVHFYGPMSLGTVHTNTAFPLHIADGLTNSSTYGMYLELNPNIVSVNGSYGQTVQRLDVSGMQIANGVINLGTVYGNEYVMYRNNPLDLGRISGALIGMSFDYGHGSSVGASARTDSAYGLYIYPRCQSGTIIYMYDLLIGSIATGGANTVHYSIFQDSLTSSNAFRAALTGFGTEYPSSRVSVNGELGAESVMATNNVVTIFHTGVTTYVNMNHASSSNSVSGNITFSYATNGTASIHKNHVAFLPNWSGTTRTLTIPAEWKTNVFSPVPANLTNGTITVMYVQSFSTTQNAANQTNVIVSFEHYK